MIVVIKVAVVLLIIGARRHVRVGRELAAVHSRRTPATFGEFGWSGIVRGAGVIFFAYIGFDAVSTAAQESRNPQRDMPRGIIGSLVICTVLYVLVSGVMVGLVPYQQLGVPAPMAVAVDAARVKAAGSSWQALLDADAVRREGRRHPGLTSTIVVQMMAQPRIFWRWRATACCRRGRRASTRGSARRI